MIWGSLIVIVACLLLMTTHLLIGQYVILAIIAYSLFGLGLAFYATPSTDAALANLPADQAGSGAGIYKMASSLGGAIGAAISLAVFTAMANMNADIVGSVIHMEGRVDNVPIRQAGMIALGVNLVFLILAILSITMTVPKGGGSRELGRSAPSPEPAPQLPPDDAKQAVLARLSALSLDELEALEKQVLVNELSHLDGAVLKQLVAERRN